MRAFLMAVVMKPPVRVQPRGVGALRRADRDAASARAIVRTTLHGAFRQGQHDATSAGRRRRNRQFRDRICGLAWPFIMRTGHR
jgi:hypothetical protein